MDLSQLSEQLHEARQDIAAGDLVLQARPTAAILLYGQAQGEILQALAGYQGFSLNPGTGQRTWGEQLWERGMLPGWDGIRDDVGTMGVMVRHIQVPFTGEVGELGVDHALFMRTTTEAVEALVIRAVESRAGPLKAAIEEAASFIGKADMALKMGLERKHERRAKAVGHYHQSAARTVKALWLKGGTGDLLREAGAQPNTTQALHERWGVLEDGGLVPPLRPSMRAMLRDLERLAKAADLTFMPRSAPDAPKITEDELGFGEQTANRVLSVAKDILAEDLAPITLPPPPSLRSKGDLSPN